MMENLTITALGASNTPVRYFIPDIHASFSYESVVRVVFRQSNDGKRILSDLSSCQIAPQLLLRHVLTRARV